MSVDVQGRPYMHKVIEFLENHSFITPSILPSKALSGSGIYWMLLVGKPDKLYTVN